jgi:hypothetical protein
VEIVASDDFIISEMRGFGGPQTIRKVCVCDESEVQEIGIGIAGGAEKKERKLHGQKK